MSTLRELGAKLLGASLLDWLAAGTGARGTRHSQTRTVAIAPPRDADETDYQYRTEREREIELRILMSNWM